MATSNLSKPAPQVSRGLPVARLNHNGRTRNHVIVHSGHKTSKSIHRSIWVFPKIVVPQNGWFLMENLSKWMIWGYPYFWKHPYPTFLHIWGTLKVYDKHLRGLPNCQSWFLGWGKHCLWLLVLRGVWCNAMANFEPLVLPNQWQINAIQNIIIIHIISIHINPYRIFPEMHLTCIMNSNFWVFFDSLGYSTWVGHINDLPANFVGLLLRWHHDLPWVPASVLRIFSKYGDKNANLPHPQKKQKITHTFSGFTT